MTGSLLISRAEQLCASSGRLPAVSGKQAVLSGGFYERQVLSPPVEPVLSGAETPIGPNDRRGGIRPGRCVDVHSSWFRCRLSKRYFPGPASWRLVECAAVDKW